MSEGIRLACAVKIEKDCRIRLPERGAEEIWTVMEEGISGGTLKRVNETEKETDKGTEREIDKGIVKETDKGIEKETDKGTEKGTDKGTEKKTDKGIVKKKETEKEIKNESADYGISIDLGTTTLAAELVNLKTGQTEAVATSVNHQRAFGADVLSRIRSSNDGKSEF